MNGRPCLWLCSLLLLGGCKTLSGASGGDPDFASDAETNLARGRDALEGKNFIDAERYFQYVKVKYPFLDVAKEAELLIADNNFERELYTEARDGYQSFVKLHPLHPKVDYAAYRAALTHWKEIPSDFILLPPSKEKDQAEIAGALKAMTNFVQGYPTSRYGADAKKIVIEAKRRLADHELYVADFYARREKWAAVVGRLEGMNKLYLGVGLDEEILFGLVDAYSHLNDSGKVHDVLKQIITRMPGTAAAARAQKLLGSS